MNNRKPPHGIPLFVDSVQSPIEAGIFYDAGVAWTQTDGAKLFGGTRNLVRSTGVSFRMNLLGYAIGQMDIVHPFDRPQKNWLVRFSLTEGF